MGVLDDADFDEVMRLQKQLASSVIDEFEMDSKIKILTIFEEVAGKKKRVQTEKLISEAEIQGLAEVEILATIEKLKKDGIIYESQLGYLQKY